MLPEWIDRTDDTNGAAIWNGVLSILRAGGYRQIWRADTYITTDEIQWPQPPEGQQYVPQHNTYVYALDEAQQSMYNINFWSHTYKDDTKEFYVDISSMGLVEQPDTQTITAIKALVAGYAGWTVKE